MNVLEKDIEDLVWGAHLHRLKTGEDILKPKGLDLYKYGFRQLNLGSYGIADLVFFEISKSYWGSWCANIQIVELKKEMIDVNALMQAARYRKGIMVLLGNTFDLEKIQTNFSYILIGKNIQLQGDFVYLADSMPSVDVFTYNIDLIHGVKFEPQYGYYLKDAQDQHFGLIKDEISKMAMLSARDSILKKWEYQKQLEIQRLEHERKKSLSGQGPE